MWSSIIRFVLAGTAAAVVGVQAWGWDNAASTLTVGTG
jgi:hypothetical protein